jgi:hypothetical protein
MAVNAFLRLTGQNRVAQRCHVGRRSGAPRKEIVKMSLDKLEVIRARCGSVLKRRLGHYAAAKELSESDVLRLALLEYLDRNAPAAPSPARSRKSKARR